MRLLLCLSAILLLNTFAFGQVVIQGKVTDNDSVGLPGVNVLVRHSTIGTTTDSEGKFWFSLTNEQIQALPGSEVMIDVSFIGYTSQQLTVDKSQLINTESEHTTVVISCSPSGGTVAFKKSVSNRVEVPLMPRFPWPPPQPSARYVLPPTLFTSAAKLGDVDAKLRTALENADFTERAYFTIPHGFVLLTRAEKITSSGESMPPEQRWAPMTEFGDDFTLKNYLRALVLPQVGYYRIIAFLVTDLSFASTNTSIGGEEMNRVFSRGNDVLPTSIGNLPYSGNYHCTAYIYVFEHRESNGIVLKTPSSLTGSQHLTKAHVLPMSP